MGIVAFLVSLQLLIVIVIRNSEPQQYPEQLQNPFNLYITLYMFVLRSKQPQ